MRPGIRPGRIALCAAVLVFMSSISLMPASAQTYPDRPITLALSGDYLSIYETQGFHPEPSAETRSAHRLLLTFDPPHGDSFVLDYDAYIQPASQRGKSGTLSLKVHGRNAASVHFHTFLWP